MKIKLSELKQIIKEETEKKQHKAVQQHEAEKAKRGEWKKQMKVRERFEDRAEKFLSKLYPRLEKLLSPLEEEAQRILETLNDYHEDRDEVYGYLQLHRFLDHDMIDLVHHGADDAEAKLSAADEEQSKPAFPYNKKN